MNDQGEIRGRLDACKYAYIAGFAEGDTSFSLEVEVIEGRLGDPDGGTPAALLSGSATPDYDHVASVMLEGSVPISVRPGCAHFTLTFDRYLMFAVRDETYAKPEPEEDFSKILRTYEKSALLDYMEKSSWGEDVIGPFKHMAVVCLDRIVDVICTKDPVISMRITDESEFI